MKKFFAFIKWLLWDFSGLRFAWGKIRPPTDMTTNKRNPATFFIWVVGIYVAFFGVASQRYENNLDRIENRTNAILVLASKDETRSNALSLIPQAQNTKLPVQPDFTDPLSSFTSIFSKKTDINKDTAEILKETIVGFKKHLSGTNLYEAYLRRADLEGADLRKAQVRYADLRGAYLMGANLEGADLDNADLRGAFMYEADLRKADLRRADLRGAYLSEVDLGEADLWGADLRRANYLTIGQLSKVYTLYDAKLDFELMEQIKKDYPHLLKKPKEER